MCCTIGVIPSSRNSARQAPPRVSSLAVAPLHIYDQFNRAGLRTAVATRGAPQIEEVLAELALGESGKIASHPQLPNDAVSSDDTTNTTAVALDEGSALERARLDAIAALLTNAFVAPWSSSASDYAEQIEWILSVADDDGEVPSQHATRLANVFGELDSTALLTSEIFSPVLLARTLRKAAKLYEEASDVSSGVPDSDSLEATLTKYGDVVATMATDDEGRLTDRPDVVAVRDMIGKLEPKQQLRYMLPLGGVDTTLFVSDAALFAATSRALGVAVEEFANSDPAHDETERAEALIEAWDAAPNVVRDSMPGTASLVQDCRRAVMVQEVQAVVDGLILGSDWTIEGCDLRGSEVRREMRNVLDQGVFVKSLPLDEDGRLQSQADREAVSGLFDLLPPHVRDEFEDADVLATTLLEVYAILDRDRQPYPEADHQLATWQDFHGIGTPVPLERAHAFFVHGKPLLSSSEVSQEKTYRFPSPLHKPETWDVNLPPRQGQLLSGPAGDDKLLRESPALYTSRVAFNEVLLWFERMLDDLDTFEMPPQPLEGESPTELDARHRALATRVTAGAKVPPPSWATLSEMSVTVGAQLSISEHRMLSQMLAMLWEHKYGGLVHDDIMMFARKGGKQRQEVVRTGVDSFGRVKSLGRRKSSQAKVLLTPGNGQVSVNGSPLSEYFSRTIDRYEVLRPLLLTNLITEVDVRCSTRGGGNTGQAGACRHAISRAIADLYPEKRPVLKKAVFLRRDPRMVERKKPGRKKARKRFQWVKR